MGIVENNLKEYRESDGAMTFFGPILSPAGLVQMSSVVTLTNAQLLALVTTPIDVIAAPGVGKVIQIVRATASLDAAAGAYTNVQATATFLFGYAGVTVKASNCASPVGTFDTAQVSIVLWCGPLLSTALGTTPQAIGGAQANYENKKIQIGATNAASGDFTGGNAANTCRVTVDYLVIDL